ncbi:MAG: FAD/NAD(P)-binding protein [Bacillota bacterium]
MADLEREKRTTMNSETAEPMAAHLYRVRRKQRETGDTVSLEIEPVNGMGIRPFRPGQFNMLYAFGVGEVPISISGDPAAPERLVHTVRAVGTVTEAICTLGGGDTLGVRGPFGTCWPVEEAAGRDVVVVAGGIGLAPLRPALYKIRSAKDKYGGAAVLYGARSPEEIVYRRELEEWRTGNDLDVLITVDRASKEWGGRVGVVTTLISEVSFDPPNTVAMICGPEAMMRFTVLELQKRGVTEDNIYISMERNMKCGVGLCGHCQLGPFFVCKDGPVLRYDVIKPFFGKREI